MATAYVLIADDDSDFRAALRLALEADGYAVDEAADGREAMSAVERCSPDVLLLDLEMPVLDGFGVLNELKLVRLAERPRVIVVSGRGSIPIAVKATRLGALAFLEKPASIEDVRTAIWSALAESLAANLAASVTLANDNDMLAGGYAAVLDRIRMALRLTNYPLAETLLMKADDLAHKDAAYFNLLGIYYESHRQWRSARKFYRRAISADKRYKPAHVNMQRLHELTTLGHTDEAVAYGDEPQIQCPDVPNQHAPEESAPVHNPRTFQTH